MSKQDRLLKLFTKINDDTIKIIIAKVVTLERQHRMSSKENFPKQKIRDIIDGEARLTERKEG